MEGGSALRKEFPKNGAVTSRFVFTVTTYGEIRLV